MLSLRAVECFSQDCKSTLIVGRITVRLLKSNLLVALAFVAICFLIAPVNAQSGSADNRGFLGVHYQMANDGKGIVVIKTVDGSPAREKLKSGDQIASFEGSQIKSLRQFQKMTSKHGVGDEIVFDVVREGESIAVKVKLTNWPMVIPELPNMNLDESFSKLKDFERVKFKSLDGMVMVADLYRQSLDADAPLIVLCHQAGGSRGEYREIAPRLNKLGYQCLAIDQRAGGQVRGVVNETYRAAVAQNKTTEFVDAEQDILAAIKWAGLNYPQAKLILWGSSYSSSLALRVVGENPDLVSGAMAFSPGEYFAGQGKGNRWIEASASKIQVPMFITSSKAEASEWRAIFEAIPAQGKISYVPATNGNHGARALWRKFDDNGGYWSAVEQFLDQF